MTAAPVDLRITILGSGTCVPSLERSASAVLIRSGGRSLLIDCGPGTMRRLLEAGSSIFEIDLLLLSHFHPDHSGELGPLLFAGKYGRTAGTAGPRQVAAGRGLNAFHRGLQSAWGSWIVPEEGRVEMTELDTGGRDRLRCGPVEITTEPVAHNPESLAFRVRGPGGRCVVYSGDTDVCEGLTRLAQGAEVLICESALPDDGKVRGHLTPSLAGDIARRAAVGRLVLTHFYPECLRTDIRRQCRRTWDGELDLAADLMEIDI